MGISLVRWLFFIRQIDSRKNLYAGVPVVIGSQGVEKVIELPLDKNEKDNFNLSINAVKELFEKAIKIDSDLADWFLILW